MKYLFINVLFIFLVSSCKEKELVQSVKHFELIGDDYSFKSEMGPYEPYFDHYDGYQSFRLEKSGLYNDALYNFFGGYTQSNLNDDDRNKSFFIDEHSIEYLKSLSDFEQDEFMQKNVGKELNFRHIENNGKEIYNIPLYTPLQIVIDTTSSGIQKIQYSKVGEFKIGSKLYYNADLKNENGLMGILSYRGHNLGMSFDDLENNNQNFQPIKKFLFKPNDNGILEFPNSFFDGLPDGALFTLHIERGTYSTFNIEEDSHKLKTSVSYSLSLALKR